MTLPSIRALRDYICDDITVKTALEAPIRTSLSAGTLMIILTTAAKIRISKTRHRLGERNKQKTTSIGKPWKGL